MNVVSNERRKGVAVKMHNDCLENLRYIRGILKYYSRYNECVMTEDSFRKCFNQLARTKIESKFKH